MNQVVYKRRRGDVVRILVELNASQAREFNDTVSRLGMTKSDAISAALNIWLNAVQPSRELSS